MKLFFLTLCLFHTQLLGTTVSQIAPTPTVWQLDSSRIRFSTNDSITISDTIMPDACEDIDECGMLVKMNDSYAEIYTCQPTDTAWSYFVSPIIIKSNTISLPKVDSLQTAILKELGKQPPLCTFWKKTPQRLTCTVIFEYPNALRSTITQYFKPYSGELPPFGWPKKQQ